MTEQAFRIVLGAGLCVLLYISAVNGRSDLILYYIGLLIFEGITNWRLAKIITAIKLQMAYSKIVRDRHKSAIEAGRHDKIPFEAERAMRLVLALILLMPMFFSNEILWILPWFVASMLLLSGVTNICPTIMFFRWAGFK